MNCVAIYDRHSMKLYQVAGEQSPVQLVSILLETHAEELFGGEHAKSDYSYLQSMEIIANGASFEEVEVFLSELDIDSNVIEIVT